MSTYYWIMMEPPSAPTRRRRHSQCILEASHMTWLHSSWAQNKSERPLQCTAHGTSTAVKICNLLSGGIKVVNGKLVSKRGWLLILIYLEKVFAERGLLGLWSGGGWSLLQSAHHPQVACPVSVLALLGCILARALKPKFYLVFNWRKSTV